ncbi:mechanosensitive ion channel domain-containing protein [Aromatoleum sp.]|uniref:mechanosensitive ion channel domain-containing protein n=1 Tax=Aromatoleum sp. TaxID=2307007 RepID=UPI002FC5D9FD
MHVPGDVLGTVVAMRPWCLRARRFRLAGGVALGLLLVLCLPSPCAWAQTPKWLTSGSQATEQRASATEPSLKEQMAAVHERLDALRKRLAESPPAESNAPLPARVTSEEWTEVRHLLGGMEIQYHKHLDSLRALEEVRRSQQELKQEGERWQRFTEPPPYPVSFVDDLWNQVRAKDREIQVGRVDLEFIESLLDDARAQLKPVRQALRQADERLAAARGTGEVVRARWLRDLAELRSRHAEATVAALESERQRKTEALAYRLGERDLLQRKALTALRLSPLSEGDRDAKLAVLADEQREIRAEIERMATEEKKTQDQLHAAREELRERSARRPPAEGQGARDDLAPLQQKLDTLKVEADLANFVLRMLRLLHQANGIQVQTWERRYRLEQEKSTKAIDDAVASSTQSLDRVRLLRAHVLSEFDLMQRRLDFQRRRLAAWQPGDGERSLAERELGAYERGEVFLRRVLAKADEVDALLSNWQEGMRLQREASSLVERMRGLIATFAEVAGQFWNFELVAVEDRIIVEGRELVGKRSVTLGKILQVVLIVVVGLWLTVYLAARGRRIMLRLYPGNESRALLIHRVLVLLAGVGLIVFALGTVNIPLTVFAFLGGALAIAAGFGAQNILNNFISGLILLIERPIKLNDIVEVEGIRGHVTNIGSRCCHVRRFDGIDMLIPNSSFLEKSVTNWTLSDPRLRFTVNLRAAYGSTIREVVALIKLGVEHHPRVLKDPAPEIYLQNFGESAFEFRVDVWVDIAVESNWQRVVSDLRVRIDELFREAGIVIAFPQRDIHLDVVQPIKIEMPQARSEPVEPSPRVR